jgi:DNA-binding transcriptional regulator YiaG
MWSESKFSSGQGTMEQSYFDSIAQQHGVEQAVWVAKYFGVALNTVKEWAKKHLN